MNAMLDIFLRLKAAKNLDGRQARASTRPLLSST